MTDPAQIARLAEGLTKAAKRAIPKLGNDWTLCTGTLRTDSYGLWWGKLHHLGLVYSPRWPGVDGLYEMRLTPRGLAVRTHLTTAAQEKKDG